MKFLIIILLFIIIQIQIQIANSKNVSPRQELQEYLYGKNCKNRLLNIFIIKQIYNNYNFNPYYYHNSYNSLNQMLKTHYPQILQKDTQIAIGVEIILLQRLVSSHFFIIQDHLLFFLSV